LKTLLTFLVSLITSFAFSQTLGGSAAYNFMKMPASPLMTAAGGVNVSWAADDVALAAANPSRIKPSMHGQLSASFNSFLAGIKAYTLGGGYHYEKKSTTFAGQVYFLDYGSVAQTDAAGNIGGNFRPVDFSVQVSASRTYLERWRYGASLKFIQSSYAQYRSNAVAADVGLSYEDSAKGFTASVLARNMGVQLKHYTQEQEDLPFDLQVGFTKRLAKAPLAFSVTAHHLHRFNILYSDTAFNNANGFESKDDLFTKTMNHFVIASHIYLGKNLEATLGYNHLRRSELNAGSSGNGLNGFSMGLRARFNKLEVQYGRSNYQRNISYNHFGIALRLLNDM
jgi:hypothetical protein